jgi:hypothetical protein
MIRQTLHIRLPELNKKQMGQLPILMSLLPQLGLGEDDYLTTKLRKQTTIKDISINPSVFALPNDDQHQYAIIEIVGNALMSNAGDLSHLMRDLLYRVRFDERDHIQKTLERLQYRLLSNVNHISLCAANVQAHLSIGDTWDAMYSEALVSELFGLSHIIHDEKLLSDYLADLNSLHAYLISQPKDLFIFTDLDQLSSSQREQLTNEWQRGVVVATPADSLIIALADKADDQAWVIETQTNKCYATYSTRHLTQEDRSIMPLIANLISNDFFMPIIREQGGAYQVGATYEKLSQKLIFHTARDPNLVETFAAFDGVASWLASDALNDDLIHSAIMSYAQTVFFPHTPFDNVLQTYWQRYFQFDSFKEQEEKHARLIGASVSDVRRIADLVLTEANRSRAAETNEKGACLLKTKLGFEIKQFIQN